VRPVEGGRYEILANAETWLCAQRLGQTKVPVFVVEDIDDEAANTITQKHHDPISEAEAFAEARLQWQGAKRGSIAGVARSAGLTRQYVWHSLHLLMLPDELKAAVREGKLSAGHARAVLRFKARKEQLSAAKRIIDDGMTVRQAESYARSKSLPSQSTQKGSRDPDIVRLERRITEHLGCEFKLDNHLGRCVINYHGELEVLEGVLEKMGYRE